jgi:hypothetical protein
VGGWDCRQPWTLCTEQSFSPPPPSAISSWAVSLTPFLRAKETPFGGRHSSKTGYIISGSLVQKRKKKGAAEDTKIQNSPPFFFNAILRKEKLLTRIL